MERLELRQVCFTYEGDNRKPALTDCSVTLGDGEKIAVLGSNGAGKSTFFLLCNGVLRPDSGQLFLAGQPVGKGQLNELRRSVGLVFQDPEVQLIGGTVAEEVSFGPMNLGLPEQEVRRRTEGAIDEMELRALAERAPQYLSGGEKKRVTLADVLAMEPEVLLLDEPASSLDPLNTALLEDTLSRLGEKGMTLVVATHDVEFAWRWAQRVLVFDGGRLAADGTPEDIFSDEALLTRCHLAQPILYQVGKLLRLTPPKTIQQLKTEIEEKQQ